MIEELPVIQQLSEARQETLRDIIATLLRDQFIFIGDRGTHGYDDLLDSIKIQDFLDSYFYMSGRTFHYHEGEKWAGVIPDETSSKWQKMKLDETQLLLVLAVMYNELIEKGSIDERAVAFTIYSDIVDRFIEIIGGKEAPEKWQRQIIKTLELFQTRRIVKLVPHEESEDFDVEIRGMVPILCAGETQARLKMFLDSAEAKASQGQQAPANDLNDNAVPNHNPAEAQEIDQQ
ncbi:DUF4194 domain-containing protein [Magnetovibrio sp. PR-2]|uniref:DUF4194 domain-containing protein n=1 Tax=Magnetovibrio sp. PR-2 TaxID=3120356 RepID=UPI002FCE365B